MSIDPLKNTAIKNYEKHIVQNIYPGRGIVIGKNEQAAWIVIYWIMGRSANSRNRVFIHENGILKTAAADESLVEDPSLIIYNAMQDTGDKIVVTNGNHTDTICHGIQQGKTFASSLETEKHEPDAPNFTPRISGCLDLGESAINLSIISKSDFSENNSAQHFYRYVELSDGFAYGITTYQGDGNPLPAFKGDPLLLPIEGDVKQVAQKYWQALNSDNRVALAVREIGKAGKDQIEIINRSEQIK